MPNILVDAGPLVALIDRSDSHHQKCVAAFKTLRDPMLTVWPAFTEAMCLLAANPRAQRTLWQMVDAGAMGFVELGADDCPRMAELMWKYRDLPMDLADAALVRAAEREALRRIFTIDREDFEIYRPHRFGHFDIIP